MREYRGKSVLSIEELNNKEIPHENGWVYGWYVDGWIVGNYAESEDEWIAFEWWSQVIPETVGQFTGLHDKNGVEIYEGDIVAFEDSDGGYEYPDVVVNTGIVEYGELRFYFTNRVAVDMEDFYIKDGRCDDVEVIGNIHDKAGDE